ncbi:MAG TPA: asparagine synthase (glutamine-hydrolyzing) [Blastocatellia bacterium]|nr:asparagine synthase (glutamine-hydrolyzing) [Blastocatellia bacterium]
MCGLVAFCAYNHVAPGIDRAELRVIRDHMASRGPDGIGEWFSPDGRVGLGHRRLSIIDLSAAASQPIANEDGSIHVVFNGEIYNYRELTKELIDKGHRFRSNSDSEVLVHLYEERGDAMVGELRGMFAFALWDANRNEMLLARDPYGIKPLYYADDGWTVRVASQVKSLVAGGGVSRMPEPAGIAGFYLFGSVPEPFTSYQEVRAVPAGSIVRVDRRGVSAPKRYFSIARIFLDARNAAVGSNADELKQAAHDAVLDSVRHHLVSDVPVSAFLSAGIDSGTIVALACEAGAENLRTVTLSFSEYEDTHSDEAPLAGQVAESYGTDHRTRLLGESEFQNELPKILAAMDQPSIDGINTYFISKAAAEVGVKVALSGLGGDELFSGYPSFLDLPRWVKTFSIAGRVPGAGRLARSVVSSIGPRGESPKLAGLLEYGATYPGAYLLRRGLFMPWELSQVLGDETAREGLRRLDPMRMIGAAIEPDPGSPYARVASLEASLYMRNQLLRDTDWSSMAHSIEVRVPLVDAFLLKALAPLLISYPEMHTKSLLAQTPSKPLPRAVTGRAKTGFTVPLNYWLERNSNLDVWRRIPALTQPGTHWSRRWAYTSVALGTAM